MFRLLSCERDVGLFCLVRDEKRPDWFGAFFFAPENTLQSKCGGGLARDEGVSAALYITDPPQSRASPLPPFICAPQLLGTNKNAPDLSVRGIS